jgi:hypothetical protein
LNSQRASGAPRWARCRRFRLTALQPSPRLYSDSRESITLRRGRTSPHTEALRGIESSFEQTFSMPRSRCVDASGPLAASVRRRGHEHAEIAEEQRRITPWPRRDPTAPRPGGVQRQRRRRPSSLSSSTLTLHAFRFYSPSHPTMPPLTSKLPFPAVHTSLKKQPRADCDGMELLVPSSP